MYFEDHLQERPITSMNKSVENLLVSSHEVITSINSSSLTSHSSVNLANGAYNDPPQDTSGTENERSSPIPSPSPSPNPSPRFTTKKEQKDKSHKDDKDHKDHKDKSHKDDKDHKDHKEKSHKDDKDHKDHKEKSHKDDKDHKDHKDKDHKDHATKSNADGSGSQKDNLTLKLSDQVQEITSRSSESTETSKHAPSEGKKERSDRNKKKSWYSNILYPTYKSRSADFKRIFKDVPSDERLIVDYSCALQREILVHGRLYVSQNYVCFYANIFTWETLVTIQWKDVTSMTKEKTALVIPNAILVSTASERFFFTSFGSRDKTFMMLFKIWQNVLMGQSMSMSEMWQLVHDCYGEELGLTSDDDDYPRPLTVPIDEKLSARLSIDSFSEVDTKGENPVSSDALAESPLSQSSPIHSASGIRAEGSNEPTDMSDSSESEEKPTLKLGIRPSTAVCSASHGGRLLIKATLPIHIDQLFTLLFTNSKFFLDFHTARKTTDLVQPSWTEDSSTGQKLRTVSLTIALSQTVGPRSSQVTETQVMLPCSSPGHLYCIDVEANNAGIPYADSFSVFSHYCMSSISENESSFAVYSEIKYKKNVWGLVKSFIEKNCWAGMQDYFNSLIKSLAVECEETGTNAIGLKRKARRRRRVTSAGVTIQTHSPDHSAYTHQPAIVDVPHIRNISVPEPRGDNSAILSWVLLAAVLCLMIVNGLLYYKLYSLEEAATYTIMDLHVLKNTPKTEEDWINLLQQQESLHNVEIKKWQRVLHTAAQLLRQTEESLTQLQMSIHPTTTEKMFSVLKPGLKTHSPQNEQPHNSEL